MTAEAWDVAVLWQHVVEAEASVNAQYLHPAGAATIHGWLCEMREAAVSRDRKEVERLAEMIHDKLALERSWYGD